MARDSQTELKEVLRDFRRDQITDTARRLFEERKSTDVSMDEIAAEAGVARSTIYVYFANRDELLRACLKRMHTLLLEAIVKAWEEESAPEARLRALFRAMLERVEDNPAFFRLAVATSGSDARVSAVGAELALIQLDVGRLVYDLIDEGVASGLFRPIDPARAMALVGQLLYGSMSVRADGFESLPLQEAADELFEFALLGLRSRSDGDR